MLTLSFVISLSSEFLFYFIGVWELFGTAWDLVGACLGVQSLEHGIGTKHEGKMGQWDNGSTGTKHRYPAWLISSRKRPGHAQNMDGVSHVSATLGQGGPYINGVAIA
jgi:hypothetical protein